MGKHESLAKCVTDNAEITIKEAAKKNNAFAMLGKILDENLRAREARYHNSCRRTYLRTEDQYHCTVNDSNADDIADKGTISEWKEQRAAYDAAFDFICEHVSTSIVAGGKVERLSMIHEKYLQHIYDNAPKWYNPNHKLDKFKDRLVAYFGAQLKFWLPTNNNRSQLIFSSRLSTGEAVEAAFESGTSEKRKLEDAACILRRNILSDFQNSKSSEMPWPPSADYLKDLKDVVPVTLTHFLSLVISTRPSSKCLSTVLRKCSSFAQDICSATTGGKWKMPKHLLLSTAMHHLTDSAMIVTILNRYGHCQSYSQTLELETAMAIQEQMQRSVLPSNISLRGNIVSHCCWDNFDIYEETPSGSGTTHTTHGIVIQEVIEGESETVAN
jgi:hypothetical protein